MSRRFALAAGALILALAGCGGSAPKRASEDARSPQTCTTGDASYAAVVRPVVERYCISCHSANGTAGDEHDFTQRDTLRAQRRLVNARLRAHSMPPTTSAQPSPAERTLVAHWADCGAALD